MNAVRGFEGIESRRLVSPSHGLVELFGRASGPGVFEGGEIVRPLADPDDVVVFGPFVFEEAEPRFDPVDAVGAVGIARKGRMGRLETARLRIQVPGLVIHAVERSVLEHRVVSGATALPGFIVIEHDLTRHRLVQAKRRAARQGRNQMGVDQRFQPRTDGDGLRVLRHRDAGGHEQSGQRESNSAVHKRPPLSGRETDVGVPDSDRRRHGFVGMVAQGPGACQCRARLNRVAPRASGCSPARLCSRNRRR